MLVKRRLRQLWSWFKSINGKCSASRREVAAATQHRGATARNRRRLPTSSLAKRGFAIQPLEARQLLASDISLADFAAHGSDFVVRYDIAAETAPAFNLSIYRSSDGVALDAFVASRAITLKSELDPGAHTIEISPDFIDPKGNYRLIAVADSLNQVAENSENNNQLAFASGVFRTPNGVLHVHGSDAAETVRIDVSEPANGSGLGATAGSSSSGSLRLSIEDLVIDYDGGSVTEVHLRLHDGDDVFNVQPNFRYSIHAYGGAGNDRILSGAGSDWLVGGAGDDFIAGGATAT